MALVAHWFSEKKHPSEFIVERSHLIEAIKQCPLRTQQAISEMEDQVKPLAELIKDCPSTLILGRGLGATIAKEGALKIKELTYMHAESYPSAEVKHGPIALVTNDKRYPVIHIIPDDENLEGNLATLA